MQLCECALVYLLVRGSPECFCGKDTEAKTLGDYAQSQLIKRLKKNKNKNVAGCGRESHGVGLAGARSWVSISRTTKINKAAKHRTMLTKARKLSGPPRFGRRPTQRRV